MYSNLLIIFNATDFIDHDFPSYSKSFSVELTIETILDASLTTSIQLYKLPNSCL